MLLAIRIWILTAKSNPLTFVQSCGNQWCGFPVTVQLQRLGFSVTVQWGDKFLLPVSHVYPVFFLFSLRLTVPKTRYKWADTPMMKRYKGKTGPFSDPRAIVFSDMSFHPTHRPLRHFESVSLQRHALDRPILLLLLLD